MKNQSNQAATATQLDQPLTNRGFLTGCVIIAEAIYHAVDAASGQSWSENPKPLMQIAIDKFEDTRFD